MEASTTTRLDDIVAGLDAYVGHVRGLGLKQTALLLEIARLDLQMRIHDISDAELDELCKAVERHGDGVADASTASPRAVNESCGTVVSLFEQDRFSVNVRQGPAKRGNVSSERGERLARGKTLVPR